MTTNPTPAPLSPEREAEASARAAQIRLGQYGERARFTVATYDSGTEKALHEIALTLSAELDRVRAERDELKKRVADARKAAINDVGDWLSRIGEEGAGFIVRTCYPHEAGDR